MTTNNRINRNTHPMHHTLFIIGLTFCLAPAMAQSPATHSLEFYKQQAREHNITLRTAANNLRQASEQRKEALTDFFPTVSATGLGFNANHDLVELNVAGMGMGLLKNGISGTVTAVQPVFAGGRIVSENKLAKVGAEARQIQMRTSQNEVDLTTEQYYWNIVKLQENLKTISVVQSQLSRLDKDVTAFVNAGITTRNDLLQVQLRENEVEAGRIKVRNALHVSRLLLAQYTGLTDDSCAVGQSIGLDTLPDYPLALRTDHDAALLRLPEYQLLEKDVEAKRLEKKLETGKYLPSVGIGAGYNYNDLTGSGKQSGMVFATLSVPISKWWGGSHAIRRRSLAVENAIEQKDDNAQLLKIRMENDWTEVDNAYQQLRLSKKSIEQSAENLRLNTDLYQAGTTTMTDLMKAQTQYQQSRDSYVEAYVNLQLTMTRYRQAVGL